ncbi:hypothetical protein RRG08_012155 [Elysia crispata]|uniref:Uncharacterized protein n=1 Tax=Elysia crispata TaxID=231223 RepID=A0AAE0ZL20_9GAST|nr:hypothetical protein RRG08_012155 [Elysia crispata]
MADNFEAGQRGLEIGPADRACQKVSRAFKRDLSPCFLSYPELKIIRLALIAPSARALGRPTVSLSCADRTVDYGKS